jgi:hypothetical protein
MKEDDDDALRRMFGESAERARVGAAPVEATMGRGRALHMRRRNTRVAVAVIALSSLGLGLGMAMGPDAGSPNPEPGSVAAPPAQAAEVRQVAPGQRVEVGHGIAMWLTSNGYHYVTDPIMPQNTAGRAVTDDRVFPVDTVDLRVYSTDAASLYTGAYRGERNAARVTVRVAGRTLQATLLTLPGNPGWSAYYTDGPFVKVPTEKGGSVQALVTVYAADGTVLATTPGTEPLAK